MSLNLKGKNNKKTGHPVELKKIIQLLGFLLLFIILINIISYITTKEVHKPENMDKIKQEHKAEMDEMDILMEKLKKEKELRDSKQPKDKNIISTKVEKAEIKPKNDEPPYQPNVQNTQNTQNVQQLFNKVNTKKEQKMTRYEDWVDEPKETPESNNGQDEVIEKNELIKINSEKDQQEER